MKFREGGSGTNIEGKGLVNTVNANTQFGVFSDVFLKEVCFALKIDCLHPFEWVPNVEVTVAAKAQEQSVSTEFDIVARHGGVHSDQFNGKGINDKFHFNCNSTADDLNDSRFGEPVNEF